MQYIDRVVTSSIVKRLKYRSSIVVTGARQTGKTTLCKEILPSILGEKYDYFCFDDSEIRLIFKKQAISILENLHTPIVILDEVQKVPEVFEAVKYIVDQKGDTKFILTGSSHILLMKNIKESLAGRISIFFFISPFPL